MLLSRDIDKTTVPCWKLILFATKYSYLQIFTNNYSHFILTSQMKYRGRLCNKYIFRHLHMKSQDKWGFTFKDSFSHFMYVVGLYMRKYCGDGKIHVRILTDLHIFSIPDYEKVIFRISSVCLPIRVPDKGLYGFYSVFKNVFSVSQCSINMDILAPKIGDTQWTSKTKWRFY
jgi:hypothetical protein